METGIKISSEGTQTSAIMMAAALDTVFESAFRNHIPVEVQLQAVAALKSAGCVENCSIMNCSVADNTKNVA